MSSFHIKLDTSNAAKYGYILLRIKIWGNAEISDVLSILFAHKFQLFYRHSNIEHTCI